MLCSTVIRIAGSLRRIQGVVIALVILTVCIQSPHLLAGQVSEQQLSHPDAYISLDSWIYSAADRLSSLGYLNDLYLGQRPWTRSTLASALSKTPNLIVIARSDEDAYKLYIALRKAVIEPTTQDVASCKLCKLGIDSLYGRGQQIVGNPLTLRILFRRNQHK